MGELFRQGVLKPMPNVTDDKTISLAFNRQELCPNIRELVFRKISLQRALVVSAESTTR
jgi:hypothetical protein